MSFCSWGSLPNPPPLTGRPGEAWADWERGLGRPPSWMQTALGRRPRVCQKAGGTHPTGLHTCFKQKSNHPGNRSDNSPTSHARSHPKVHCANYKMSTSSLPLPPPALKTKVNIRSLNFGPFTPGKGKICFFVMLEDRFVCDITTSSITVNGPLQNNE